MTDPTMTTLGTIYSVPPSELGKSLVTDFWDTLGQPGKPQYAIVGIWTVARHWTVHGQHHGGWACVTLGRRFDPHADPLFPTARQAAEALHSRLEND